MNEDICPIVPANTGLASKATNWQNILIMVGLTILFLFLCYFFYRFVSHTNNRFKMVETAINQMNDRIREKPAVAPGNPFQHLFVPQPHAAPVSAPPSIPVPVSVPMQAPARMPAEVVVDAKVLDKELSEELKELVESVEKHDGPEGRVDEEDAPQQQAEAQATVQE